LNSDVRAETVTDFRPGLRSVITEVIASAAPEVDRLGAFPRAALDALAEVGILGLMSSSEVGAAGRGLRIDRDGRTDAFRS
jgi:isovaleryl-CoA dehydrogenase